RDGDGRWFDEHHGNTQQCDVEYSDSDGNSGNAAVDRGHAGSGDGSEGTDAAVQRGRDLQRQHDADPDDAGDVDVFEHGGSDDRIKRPRDSDGRWFNEHHGDVEYHHLEYSDSDGNSGNAAVDRGHTGSAIDREGCDTAVHGDGDV